MAWTRIAKEDGRPNLGGRRCLGCAVMLGGGRIFGEGTSGWANPGSLGDDGSTGICDLCAAALMTRIDDLPILRRAQRRRD